MTVPLLVAEIQTWTLLRSLGIALVVISPLGWVLWRRVRAGRSNEDTATAPEERPADRPRLEDVIRAVDDLASGTGTGPAGGTLLVPVGVTIDGRVPEDGVVDLLVRDALRRSGLVATAELDTPEGRLIECRPSTRASDR